MSLVSLNYPSSPAAVPLSQLEIEESRLASSRSLDGRTAVLRLVRTLKEKAHPGWDSGGTWTPTKTCPFQDALSSPRAYSAPQVLATPAIMRSFHPSANESTGACKLCCAAFEANHSGKHHVPRGRVARASAELTSFCASWPAARRAFHRPTTETRASRQTVQFIFHLHSRLFLTPPPLRSIPPSITIVFITLLLFPL